VAKERKRLRALEQILTAEEALVFASVLADVVKGLVNDRDVSKPSPSIGSPSQRSRSPATAVGVNDTERYPCPWDRLEVSLTE